MPKGALILQFPAGLPTSGKEAKPEELNHDGHVIQCFVNATLNNNSFWHLIFSWFVEASQYYRQRMEEAGIVHQYLRTFAVKGSLEMRNFNRN